METESVDILIYLSVCVVVLPLGVVVNSKLYRNIKNEEHREEGKVVQYIMKQYALLQCIAWPVIAAFVGLLLFYDGVFEIMQGFLARYLIFSFRFLYVFIRNYISLNSLIVATVRYVFLVFERQVQSFGVRKLRSVFICSIIGLPIFNAFLSEVTQPMEQVYISQFFNRIPLKDTDNISASLSLHFSNNTYESPIYVAFNNNAPRALVGSMIILADIMIIVSYSNLLEGLIYTHLYIVYQR